MRLRRCHGLFRGKWVWFGRQDSPGKSFFSKTQGSIRAILGVLNARLLGRQCMAYLVSCCLRLAVLFYSILFKGQANRPGYGELRSVSRPHVDSSCLSCRQLASWKTPDFGYGDFVTDSLVVIYSIIITFFYYLLFIRYYHWYYSHYCN